MCDEAAAVARYLNAIFTGVAVRSTEYGEEYIVNDRTIGGYDVAIDDTASLGVANVLAENGVGNGNGLTARYAYY